MDEAKFILFTLLLARVTGLVMTAPIYGTSDVPMQIRALLSAALAMVMLPTQWSVVVSCSGIAQYAVLLGCEAAIGACLGLGVLILVHGMTLAGELIGQVAGFSMAEAFDPTIGENVPQLSRLMFLTAVCAFLCIGGHRMVMAGLLDTFQTMPLGCGQLPDSLADAFVTLVTQSFSLGIRAAAPAVTALLLATVVLGMIGRTLPQLNVLSVGLGLNALLTFAVLGLTLGAAVWAFDDQIEPAMEALFDALKTPLNTEYLKRG